MRATIAMPSQYALKLPATRPDSTLSEAPPSRDDVTTSRTWLDSVEVKTLTSSGMIAPARVPQVMTVESFHQSDAVAEVADEEPRGGVGQDHRHDRGEPHQARERGLEVHAARRRRTGPGSTDSLIRYEAPLATIMRMRMMKIQARSCTWTAGSRTARRMKEIRATPVTP